MAQQGAPAAAPAVAPAAALAAAQVGQQQPNIPRPRHRQWYKCDNSFTPRNYKMLGNNKEEILHSKHF